MMRLLSVGVLVLAFGTFAFAQEDGVCPNINLDENCYFDGVATLPPSGANANQFFVIGGLFDIHAKGIDAYSCADEISKKAILNVLAFFWAVNFYGKRQNQQFNDNISVGAFAFDNCFRPHQTVENLLGFSQCKLFLKGIRENVVAYVGPYIDADAESIAPLASDLSLTLVSPDANTYRISNESKRSLLQIQPDFDYNLKAIVDFIRLVGAEHVIVMHCDWPLYIDAHTRLLEMLNMTGNTLCLHRDITVPFNSDDAIMDKAINEYLVNQGDIRYIVPLMCPPQVKRLMTRVAANANVNDKFIYIVNGEVGRDLDIVTDRVVVVEQRRTNTLGDFQAALQEFRQNATNSIFGGPTINNPWLKEFLDQPRAEIPLLDDDNLPSTTILSVGRTIAAVRHIISGMNDAMSACSNSGGGFQLCDDLRNPKTASSLLSNAISVAGRLENSRPRPEDSHFDYFVFRNQDLVFHKIGEYDAGNSVGTLSVPEGIREWFNTHFVPSVCPDREGCCVQATMAPSSSMTDEMQVTADPLPTPATQPPDEVKVTYPKGQQITGAFYPDGSITHNYDTRFDIGHNWVIALGVLAGLGILCVVVFEIYIMYKLVGTRMGNKWRTMWLGQLLLFGIFLGYLTLIAFIFVPTDATCGIIRFGVGFSYAVCFAVLLVKLMVIFTSKSSDVLLPGDGESPNYLRGSYQFLMFVFAVGVQVVIDVQWLITIPPEAVPVLTRSNQTAWVCNHYTWEAGLDMFVMKDFVRTNFENHILSLIYIMVLILITTLLSLNAHGIITNHRESVFIGIAAGFSIPIWLAWTLVGGLNFEHDYAHEFGDACLAFGLLLTITLILFAMFLPKVRQLVNMGIEGIYLEDDRDTYYGGSVIMSPPSFKSRGPSSVIYVNNQGIYSDPVIVGDHPTKDLGPNYLKHPGSTSTYSAPPTFIKKSQSTYGGSQVLRMTNDLKGGHPSKKSNSEVNYGGSIKSRSNKGTLKRGSSQPDLGAL